MDQWLWIAIIVVLVVIAAIALLVWRTSTGRRLRQRFGPEYGRTVERAVSKQRAHEELEHRLERRESYDLRSLGDDERARYVERWKQLQRHFTKQPATGLLEADELLTRLLADVGYPTDSFEQQAADLSAAHADVVDDYRQARSIAADTREGRAGTEEIRHALLRYRRVFERVAEADASSRSDEAAVMSDAQTAAGLMLLDDDERTMLRERWRQVEERFVDDPAGAVRQADALVQQAIDRIRATLDSRRQTLSQRPDSVEDATTEQLRAVLHDYQQLHAALTDAPAPPDWHRPEDTGQQRATHQTSATRRSRDGDPHDAASVDR